MSQRRLHELCLSSFDFCVVWCSRQFTAKILAINCAPLDTIYFGEKTLWSFLCRHSSVHGVVACGTEKLEQDQTNRGDREYDFCVVISAVGTHVVCLGFGRHDFPIHKHFCLRHPGTLLIFGRVTENADGTKYDPVLLLDASILISDSGLETHSFCV